MKRERYARRGPSGVEGLQQGVGPVWGECSASVAFTWCLAVQLGDAAVWEVGLKLGVQASSGPWSALPPSLYKEFISACLCMSVCVYFDVPSHISM